MASRISKTERFLIECLFQAVREYAFSSHLKKAEQIVLQKRLLEAQWDLAQYLER